MTNRFEKILTGVGLVAALVLLALQLLSEPNDIMMSDITIRTFEEEGVLTNNKGLVIQCRDKKFHVTISE